MIPDVDDLFEATQEWKSIRVNTVKIEKDKLCKRLKKLSEIKEVKEMPWYENGLFVEGTVAKNIEHYLG